MKYGYELAAMILATFLALMGAAFAADPLFQAHAWILFFILSGSSIVLMRRVQFAPAGQPATAEDTSGYMDDVVRYGVIATVFWGVTGFLVGVIIAAQLAWPMLNLEPYLNFGRLRPVHTSAVVFAFGGNALLCTSLYVVQRTCRARLWGGNLAWFVFWGYQLFIVMAATGYLLGITQSREYAEPEWYVDIWLTIVWVAYLAVYIGTIVKRKEPHIYVANWFYLSFIITIAMLHVVNNMAIPVSFLGAKSYSAFAGVQDALTQWWYGHNAVGFFLTAGFLGMMYYFVPKQAERPIYSYRLSIIHFWSLIFLYIWAGPHHLHYTALPDWAQTLGMVFSIMLWMPSWGGMINGLMTLVRGLGQVAHRPHSSHDGARAGILRHVDIRRPDDVDQVGQLAVPLHGLDHWPRAFRCAWLGRHDLVWRHLLHGSKIVAPRQAVFVAAGQLALVAGHHRHRDLRGRLVGCRHHAGPDVARV